MLQSQMAVICRNHLRLMRQNATFTDHNALSSKQTCLTFVRTDPRPRHIASFNNADCSMNASKVDSDGIAEVLGGIRYSTATKGPTYVSRGKCYVMQLDAASRFAEEAVTLL